MPEENKISLKLPAETIAEVNSLISSLRSKLSPYLIALTPEDRHMLLKMSDKTLPFVNKVSNYVQTNPSFNPPYLNIEEFLTDVKAADNLLTFILPLSQLLSNLEDTTMLCGSEAYSSALTYYNSVKAAAKVNVPDAKTIYDDLSMRFNVKTKKAVVTEDSPRNN